MPERANALPRVCLELIRGLCKATLDVCRLQIEYVLQGAVEGVGPETHSGFGFNQLRGDTDAIAALARAALEHVARA